MPKATKAKQEKRDRRKRDETERLRKAKANAEVFKKKRNENEKKLEALRKKLEAKADKAEAEKMKMDIDQLEKEIQEDKKAAKAAEAIAQDAEDQIAEVDKMVIDDEEEEEEEKGKQIDPDNPIETSKRDPYGVSELTKALQAGLKLDGYDSTEPFDISTRGALRDSQGLSCWKNGLGKPVIIVDIEVPRYPIYRIRTDIVCEEDELNLMHWRRASKEKGSGNKNKWSVEDVYTIRGIAIEVPPGYSGNPEDLVKLIPKLSGWEKDELKEKGKPMPRQPDVQVLVEWKEAIKIKYESGREELRYTSWESRSGCRIIWKKHSIADGMLLRFAMERERGYRAGGGRHSVEERSMSPFEIPSAGSTPLEGTPVVITPENSPPPEGPPGGKSSKSTGSDKPTDKSNAAKKREARKEFKSEWCYDHNVDPEKMTDTQTSSMMAAFQAFWNITTRTLQEAS